MRQLLHLPRELDGQIWQYNNLASANRRHTHAELELNLVTRGRGIYLIGTRRYEIRRGDLLWLFPSQDHVLIEQTADFRMWIAVFRRRMIRRIALDAATQPLTQTTLNCESCRRLISKDMERLNELFLDLAAFAHPSLLNSGIAYALLLAWESFQHASNISSLDVHPAVERASRLIRDGDFTRSLTELAHDAGLSAGRLSRLFHEQTGFTLVDFRNRQRIERFLDLYGTGQRRTMLDAALEAGFGSYPQFHRVFHQVFGCSPRTYRHEGK